MELFSDDEETDMNQCAMTVESAEASEQTKECLAKLAQRSDLTKVVFIVHGFMESSGAEWMVEMQHQLNENDREAAVVVCTYMIFMPS